MVTFEKAALATPSGRLGRGGAAARGDAAGGSTANGARSRRAYVEGLPQPVQARCFEYAAKMNVNVSSAAFTTASSRSRAKPPTRRSQRGVNTDSAVGVLRNCRFYETRPRRPSGSWPGSFPRRHVGESAGHYLETRSPDHALNFSVCAWTPGFANLIRTPFAPERTIVRRYG